MFGASNAKEPELDAWTKVEVPFVRQKQDKWCWAACCESFTAFYHRQIKGQYEYILLCQEGFQEGMAQRVHKSAVNDFANPMQYFSILERVMGKPLKIVEPGWRGETRPSQTAIKATLVGGRIFIMCSQHHCRILCGYGVKPGGKEEGLYCMDPEEDNLAWVPWSLYNECVALIWVPKGTFS